jgi:hypothetical protein
MNAVSRIQRESHVRDSMFPVYAVTQYKYLHSRRLSYGIWGGLASNMIWETSAASGEHYCVDSLGGGM